MITALRGDSGWLSNDRSRDRSAVWAFVQDRPLTVVVSAATSCCRGFAIHSGA